MHRFAFFTVLLVASAWPGNALDEIPKLGFSQYSYSPSPIAGRERISLKVDSVRRVSRVTLSVSGGVGIVINGCQVTFDVAANRLSLEDANGGQMVTPGADEQVSNAFCTLYAANSGPMTTAVFVTPGIGVTFEIATASHMVGDLSVYAMAVDEANESTDWRRLGSYFKQSPDTGSLYEASISFDHPAGGTSVRNMYFVANQTLSNVGGCFLWINAQTSTAYLANEVGTTWSQGKVIGQGVTLSNSLCDITFGSLTFSVAGNTAAATFRALLKPMMVGTNRIYTYADGTGGWTSPWREIDAQTVSPGVKKLSAQFLPIAPRIYSASVSLGPLGGTDAVKNLYVVSNRLLSNSEGCFLWFNLENQTVSLANEQGTAWGSRYFYLSLQPQSVVQNSLCRVTLTQTPATSDGIFRLGYNIEYLQPMARGQRVFAYAEGPGIHSEWTPLQGLALSN